MCENPHHSEMQAVTFIITASTQLREGREVLGMLDGARWLFSTFM